MNTIFAALPHWLDIVVQVLIGLFTIMGVIAQLAAGLGHPKTGEHVSRAQAVVGNLIKLLGGNYGKAKSITDAKPEEAAAVLVEKTQDETKAKLLVAAKAAAQSILSK